MNISDSTSEPLENAAVQVFQNDIFVEGGYSDSLGNYALQVNRETEYSVLINFLGYQNKQLRFQVSEDTTLYVVLEKDGAWLNEVTVEAARQYIKREGNQIVMQIGGRNDLGNNAIEILQNAPGVQVLNGNISLLGQATRIFINGRPSKYTATQLLNFLKNKNAFSIERIELITTPSAEFDASMQDKVVNIITRRKEGNGYTIGFASRATQRSQHTSFSGGLDVYVRTGKFGIYGSGDAYLDRRFERTDVSRIFDREESVPTFIEEQTTDITEGWGPSYSLGVDYDLSPNTIIGAKYLGYNSDGENLVSSRSEIFQGVVLDSIIQFSTVPERRSIVNTYNLNLRSTIDTLRSYINIDLDYDIIDYNVVDNQILQTLSSEGTPSGQTDTRLQRVDSKDVLVGAKIDLRKNFAAGTLKAGLKYSNSDIQQLTDQIFRSDNTVISTFYDLLDYTENIYSAYASYDGQLGKYNYSIGLRGEYTQYEGQSLSGTEDVADRYFSLFPTLSVNRSYGDKHYASLSFSRNIRRPTFNQLIPFQRYTSTFFYYTGNPNLRAYFPYSLETYYSYRNRFFVSTFYNKANDRILEFDRRLEDDSNITVGVKENNGYAESYGIGVGYNGKITSWLSLNSNTYYYAGTQALQLENTQELFDYRAYSIYFTPQFKFSKGFRGNISFYYNSDVYNSLSRNLSYWYFGFYLSKNILGGAGQISLTARDLFLTGITRRVADYADINYSLRKNWDSRIFQLAFSYNIGVDNVKRKRRRSRTANSDVRRRSSQ